MGGSMEKRIDAVFYPAIVEQYDNAYRVFFPDLPRCSSEGETWQDACRNAELALSSYLDLSLRHGQPVAEPSPDPSHADRDTRGRQHIMIRGERAI